ncbi:bifunctional adenosylcobinamide kinase/adenosylcobinamide-phosphate guanylyltransferase [Roseovarius sp. ZX-A-9]|uniref:bifunctional adenosylcobinamide kinase/adenosylcobinamide-phosphate guanylyltransferase n=1 Tax=Roseovarius sp. ZX-A-9 TaxID=3014783 RepID=UPI00232D442D|nr:bifunctional adenosylcobinamide kinase/adenosylcobinamide-phosphate guanylyltransferase [Roseovarius sp. ZX-A-9]MDX1785712.1 bifunctional adenosylcobinamide kinase/adenosylcobinamide-phosphate guanylyltransferase [Roseovarius sp.]
MFGQRALVLGGSASGKSSFAEGLARDTGRARIYLATAQAFDAEMAQKVARHQQLRGDGWHTIEAPLDPGPVLAEARADQVVLLDCATMWLSNHMLAGDDLDVAEAALMAGLAACRAQVIIVSNELGLSVVPDNALARRFRDAQGRLNQRLAAQADLVALVMAGLPMALKGTLP